MNKKVLFIVHAAVIAALYVVLTLAANALGLANYAIQVRFSEALTILPLFFSPCILCIIRRTLIHGQEHEIRLLPQCDAPDHPADHQQKESPCRTLCI